jgi:hypothetical protein
VASGLGGLLATGQQTKQQATAGLLGAARLEAQQDIAERQLEMQKEAGQQQLMGTAVGIGGAIGAKAAGTAVADLGAGATLGAKAGAVAKAMAPPVLIALAAAALLNKLFD